MAGIWFLLTIPTLIMVDSVATLNLRMGLLYCVQGFLMYTDLGDCIFLGFKVIKCFGSSGCAPNGTLYAVVLLFVLAQALLCATMSYLLFRMPFSPTIWLRNPATLVECNNSGQQFGTKQTRVLGRDNPQ